MSNDTATNNDAGPVTPPVTDWASDYDIFDPRVRRRSVPDLGRTP